MAIDTFSYAKQKSIKHIVTSAENSANLALIPVISGVPLPTDDFIYQMNIRTSAYRDKTNGVDHKYEVTSGVVALYDGGTNLATGDIVDIIGSFV